MLSRKSTQVLFALSIAVTATSAVMAQENAAVLPQSGPVSLAANNDFHRTSQVLGVPSSYCGHVIDLMMRTRMLQQAGQCGHVGEVFMPHLSVGLKPGDLELLGVHLVCDGDATKGPVFEVAMRNNSNVPVGNFRVSLVGVHGRINVHSPSTTICVPRIEACQESRVQIQLPITCMTMCQGGFDTLVVALDSFDDLIECNEVNNLLIVPRCDVALHVQQTVVPGAPAATPVAPATPAPPAPGIQSAPVESAPTSPQDKSPLDDIDVDDLATGSAAINAAAIQ